MARREEKDREIWNGIGNQVRMRMGKQETEGNAGQTGWADVMQGGWK